MNDGAITDGGEPFDLLVVGGGINGAGVARDAAGRGLSVALVEQDDLASATSSASSKLVHGGLRYLEHYEFALVRESLKERAILLDAAPHLVHPQVFVLPHGPGMRPAWMLRLGLFLYDHLSTAHPRLFPSRRIDIRHDPAGRPLAPGFDTGFVYADCTVDDTRLVVLNAVDAFERGAQVLTRTKLVSAARDGGLWRAVLQDLRTGNERTVEARALANVAGPWARSVIDTLDGVRTTKAIRPVKGSHIVVPKLFDGDQAYILQNDDGRIVFVIPFHGEFTLIGTTEVEMTEPPAPGPHGVTCTAEETAYLCGVVNHYFTAHIDPADVLWAFAGVRPLIREDDASAPGHATAASREYAFEFEAPAGGAPLLSVFGGKLTTYRRLAELAVDRLCAASSRTSSQAFSKAGPAWTAHAPLPGGELAAEDTLADLLARLKTDYADIEPEVLDGLARRHGTRALEILGAAQASQDLGEDFGHGLTAREVDHLIDREWAQTADDILWRRTKMGLRLDAAARARLEAYVKGRIAPPA